MQEENKVEAPGIKCPECGRYKAVIYKHPHEFAGQYECKAKKCWASWECEHPVTHDEDYEYPQKSYETAVHQTKLTICDDCDKDVTEEF